jgi:hypothetical protein
MLEVGVGIMLSVAKAPFLAEGWREQIDHFNNERTNLACALLTIYAKAKKFWGVN